MDRSKILIVEDDDFLRDVYVDTLTNEGYQVDIATNGNEGFEKIRQGGYDLVLLDIILPQIDGLEIMRRVKADPDIKQNKLVVFLTNLDNDNELKEALKLGNGYLIKSQLTPGDLVHEVKLYLSKTPS